MKLILKRLELIKTAIAIEDEEIINLQVEKFDLSSCDEEIKGIIEKVKVKDYGNVAVMIEEYLKRYSGVMVYEDEELQGLKFELKALENELQNLSAEKSKYLNDIREFNIQYYLKLGDVIKELLDLKKELLLKAMEKKQSAFDDVKAEYEEYKTEYEKVKSQKEAKEKELEGLDEFDDEYEKQYEELQNLKSKLDQMEKELSEKRKKAKKAKDKLKEDEAFKEYEEINRDFNEFNEEYEEIKNEDRFELSKEEMKELKQLYKKAAMLCHPDVVADEFKQEALEVFHQLNEAHEKQDINTIREILENLKNHGFGLASDAIDDKDLLRNKIVHLRKTIAKDKEEIEMIKEDESYKILQENEDLDKYFEELRAELKNECEQISVSIAKKIS